MLILALLAAFAGATVLGPTWAAGAAAEMAMADRAAPGSGGCDPCPGEPETGKAPCDEVCLAPFAAILAAGGVIAPAAAAAAVVPAAAAEHGRTGPPDPGPPRPAAAR